MDEVLAVGDREFRKKCLGRIGEVSRDDGRTILFVSHDLNAIISTCSRAVLVERGSLVANGPTEDVVQSTSPANRRRRQRVASFVVTCLIPAVRFSSRLESRRRP